MSSNIKQGRLLFKNIIYLNVFDAMTFNIELCDLGDKLSRVDLDFTDNIERAANVGSMWHS